MSKVVITGIDTNALPKLSGKEQLELMIKLKAGDMVAREEFAVCNMRLVLSVLQRFRGRCDNTDDLFQVGCVGLMKAIDNFDVNQNVKFSTYAVPMIIGEIKRYLRDNNSIRISRQLKDIAYQALKLKENYMIEFQKEPTNQELSSILGIDLKLVNDGIKGV